MKIVKKEITEIYQGSYYYIGASTKLSFEVLKFISSDTIIYKFNHIEIQELGYSFKAHEQALLNQFSFEELLSKDNIIIDLERVNT